MKKWTGIVVVVVLSAAVFLLYTRNSGSSQVHIVMETNPFPLALGDTTVAFKVQHDDGTPVDATVSMNADMTMEGMLPVNVAQLPYKDGYYQTNVMWPMAGQWLITVSAKLPGVQTPLQESFAVYIYSTTVDNPGGPKTYRTVAQDASVNTDPEHQYYVVIPQGTRVLMQQGQAHDVIPSLLQFNVKGLNTLVIQNNDVVDHVIGPYLVKAGETVRQTFTQPAVYQGKCSANTRATIKIVVDA